VGSRDGNTSPYFKLGVFAINVNQIFDISLAIYNIARPLNAKYFTLK
jgi:hypothetical protein